jgi:hypothetical protein
MTFRQEQAIWLWLYDVDNLFAFFMTSVYAQRPYPVNMANTSCLSWTRLMSFSARASRIAPKRHVKHGQDPNKDIDASSEGIAKWAFSRHVYGAGNETPV